MGLVFALIAFINVGPNPAHSDEIKTVLVTRDETLDQRGGWIKVQSPDGTFTIHFPNPAKHKFVTFSVR